MATYWDISFTKCCFLEVMAAPSGTERGLAEVYGVLEPDGLFYTRKPRSGGSQRRPPELHYRPCYSFASSIALSSSLRSSAASASISFS